MGELIKCTKKVCARCKYRCRFGTAPSGAQRLYNFCCNYLEITGHSRIFVKGHRRDIPKGYCDKFEPGKAIQPRNIWYERKGRVLLGHIQQFYTRGGKLHINDYYGDIGSDRGRDV